MIRSTGQILTNLISNALKFTEEGNITIKVAIDQSDSSGSDDSLDSPQKMLKFSVIDTGVGLSDNAQQNLFKPFTQADSSTSRKYGGTGLGLSISKSLAELMGGDIGVESTLGEGSEFWFSVAYMPASSQVVKSNKQHSTERWQASRSLKILVAEDTDVMQHMIFAIFHNLNHRVVIAENGRKAVECHENDDFDIILMDVRMPVVDGLEATTIIRAMGGDKSKIPIIALTADIAAGNILEYTNIGMNQVCSKPINLPILLKAIDNLMGEEIHTSISIESPESENRRIEGRRIDSNESYSSFDQVIEHVSRMADDIKVLGEEDAGSLMKIEGAPPEKIAELMANYEKSQIVRCEELIIAFADLEKNLGDEDIKGKVKNLTHAMKGAGGTYGYHLTSIIATKADEYLAGKDQLHESDVQFLANHVEALSLVANKKLAGHGGNAGAILLQGLTDFS